MRKLIGFFYVLFCMTLLSGCYYLWTSFTEPRTDIIGTNIIGIVGEASDEPYIEIQYSVADTEKTGFNKTISEMISLPYIFQNESVLMTFEYSEISDNSDGLSSYEKRLLRDFDNGGAEYLRIINHSPDKTVEFFIAGAYTEEKDGGRHVSPRTSPINEEYIYLPEVWYGNTPIYFLLYPERKPPNANFTAVTKAWSVEEVVKLYRAEYARSEETQLTLYRNDYYRIIDLVEGRGWADYLRDSIFYGKIEPNKEFQGNDRLWLLSTRSMFSELLETGTLR